MAKKMHKPTEQSKKNRRQQTGEKLSDVAAANDRYRERRAAPHRLHPLHQGLPEEHYLGEETADRIGGPVAAGDLELETLAPQAPFNRTFGKKDSIER